MANCIYLCNVDPSRKEIDIIGEWVNDIPLIWCLLFNIKDLILNSEFNDDNDQHDEVERLCTVTEARNNLKSKTDVALKAGVSKDIIESFDSVLKSLKRSHIIANIRGFWDFFSTDEECEMALKDMLSFSVIKTKFPNITSALELLNIFETLNLPIPEAIKIRIPQRPEVERKERELCLKPTDSSGNLLADYFIAAGFSPLYFTPKNNHNPLVRHSCDECRGRGFIEIVDPPIGSVVCNNCCGSGCENILKPMFSVIPDQKITAKLHEDGYVRCPRCKKLFSTNDSKRWTGLRHHCGQQIIFNKDRQSNCLRRALSLPIIGTFLRNIITFSKKFQMIK